LFLQNNMDNLSDLPIKNDTVKTKEEVEVIEQFFPGKSVEPFPGGAPQNDSGNTLDTLKTKLNWKLIGLSSLLFVALANPFIDGIFCKIPYCGDNAMTMLGIKVFLFIITMIIISFFC